MGLNMAPETVVTARHSAWPRVTQGGSEMNGDDLLSGLRQEVRSYADARGGGLAGSRSVRDAARNSAGEASAGGAGGDTNTSSL